MDLNLAIIKNGKVIQAEQMKLDDVETEIIDINDLSNYLLNQRRQLENSYER